MNATPKQTFYLFCMTKFDVRECGLSLEKASFLISLAKTDLETAIKTISNIPGAVKKGEVGQPKQDWQRVYDKARQAGIDAGTLALPTPMVVEQHSNMLNDKSPVVQSWTVSEGCCGFAYVTIFPGNCSFANWLKKNDLGCKAYQGGCQIWVHDFNQSMERKEKYAYAFAQVLTEHGIKAYAGSRMD
jgi:hypothetical protein